MPEKSSEDRQALRPPGITTHSIKTMDLFSTLILSFLRQIVHWEKQQQQQQQQRKPSELGSGWTKSYVNNIACLGLITSKVLNGAPVYCDKVRIC